MFFELRRDHEAAVPAATFLVLVAMESLSHKIPDHQGTREEDLLA